MFFGGYCEFTLMDKIILHFSTFQFVVDHVERARSDRLYDASIIQRLENDLKQQNQKHIEEVRSLEA